MTLSGVLQCQGTVIVVEITKHGIVLGADGKVTETDAKPGPFRPSGFTTETKIRLVGDRIAVACTGSEEISYTSSGSTPVTPFSIPRIITNLGAKPPLAPSVVAEMIKMGISSELNDGFDEVLTQGGITRKALQRDFLVMCFVTGYESKVPRLFEIVVPIDWQRHMHSVTSKPVYPGENKNFYFRFLGNEERGIVELLTKTSAVHERAMTDMPTEVGALLEDRDLDLIGMAKLARRLMDVEIERAPELVGYPLGVYTIPATGTPSMKQYIGPLKTKKAQ